MLKCICLKSGVRGHLGDTARTVLLFNILGDTDETVLSPGARPRILDLPEVVSIVGSKSYEENAMVELSSLNSGEDATVVQLPVRVGINSDGNRLLRDSSGKGLLRVTDIGVGKGSGSINGGEALASGVLSTTACVRVRLLGTQTVTLDVLESIVHEPSVASHVAEISVARDKLLLGEHNLLLVLQVVGTLNGAGSGESPATTTSSLVLDGGDHIGGGPVDGIGCFDALEVVDHPGPLSPRGRLGEVEALELGEGEVRELVVA